jgi:hypothetical protein
VDVAGALRDYGHVAVVVMQLFVSDPFGGQSAIATQPAR